MSDRDTIPAPPADRSTDPGQPDGPSAPVLDFSDRVFTQLAIMSAKQDEWGMQIVEQLAGILAGVQSLSRQFDLLTQKFIDLQQRQGRTETRLKRLEARVDLLETPEDHGPNGTSGNGSLPPEQ